MPNSNGFSTSLTPDDVATLRAARARQKSRYAVGPFWPLVIDATRTLPPGSPLELQDLPRYVDRTPLEHMRGLIDSARVIELTDEELAANQTPADARFVVAPGKAVATVAGVAAPGQGLKAEDFPTGEARIRQLVAAGYVLDRAAARPEPRA